MTEQRLSPKSIAVLRQLLAAHPDPVLGKNLNGHILPRLEKNNPQIARPCAIPDEWQINGRLPSSGPAYCLTRYGLLVAQAIPADTPEEPDAPIYVNIETGKLIPVPDAPRTQDKQYTYSSSHYKRNSNGGPPRVDDRPLPQPRASTPQAPADTPPTVTVPATQPEPPARMDDPTPCGDCPERDELALIYKILPELRDHIQPLIALKRKLDS